jgi:hypothetical protein
MNTWIKIVKFLLPVIFILSIGLNIYFYWFADKEYFDFYEKEKDKYIELKDSLKIQEDYLVSLENLSKKKIKEIEHKLVERNKEIYDLKKDKINMLQIHLKDLKNLDEITDTLSIKEIDNHIISVFDKQQ